jgi:hypothetical protein
MESGTQVMATFLSEAPPPGMMSTVRGTLLVALMGT